MIENTYIYSCVPYCIWIALRERENISSFHSQYWCCLLYNEWYLWRYIQWYWWCWWWDGMYVYVHEYEKNSYVFFSCEIVSFTIIITGKSEKKKQAKILPLLLSEWEKKIVKRVHMDSRRGDIACFHHEHHHITENSSIQAAIHPFRQDISTHNSKNASASANNLLHSKKFLSPRRRRKKHPSLSS